MKNVIAKDNESITTAAVPGRYDIIKNKPIKC